MSVQYESDCYQEAFCCGLGIKVCVHSVFHSSVKPSKSLMMTPNMAYSAAEMGRIKQDCVRDVRSMLQLLASTRSESMTEEIVSGCVSIELYLNMDLMLLERENKRAHAQAVIEGQHMFDVKELANTSIRGSHWARERAAVLLLQATSLPLTG